MYSLTCRRGGGGWCLSVCSFGWCFVSFSDCAVLFHWRIKFFVEKYFWFLVEKLFLTLKIIFWFKIYNLIYMFCAWLQIIVSYFAFDVPWWPLFVSCYNAVLVINWFVWLVGPIFYGFWDFCIHNHGCWGAKMAEIRYFLYEFEPSGAKNVYLWVIFYILTVIRPNNVNLLPWILRPGIMFLLLCLICLVLYRISCFIKSFGCMPIAVAVL